MTPNTPPENTAAELLSLARNLEMCLIFNSEAEEEKTLSAIRELAALKAQQSDGNYPEDAIADPDRGNYTFVCTMCSGHFRGFKRRVICKVCASKKAQQPSLPDMRRESLQNVLDESAAVVSGIKEFCESPEDAAEYFIRQEIDRAPEALRRLGEYLTNVLDEDQWKTAQRMLLGACSQAQQPSGAQAGLLGRMAEALRITLIGMASVGVNHPKERDVLQEAYDHATAILAEYDASPLPGDGGGIPEALAYIEIGEWFFDVGTNLSGDTLRRVLGPGKHYLTTWPHPSPLPASEPPPSPCVNKDNPNGCYRVRCQLGNKCVDDEFSNRGMPVTEPATCPHATSSPLRYCDPCPVSPCPMEATEPPPQKPDMRKTEFWKRATSELRLVDLIEQLERCPVFTISEAEDWVRYLRAIAPMLGQGKDAWDGRIPEGATVQVMTPPLPESEVIGYLRKHVETLSLEIARLRHPEHFLHQPQSPEAK